MTTISKPCQFCNHSFDAPLKEHNRGRHRFCSLSCAAKYRNETYWAKLQRPNSQCAHCGAWFYKKPSSKKNSKSGLFFCCRAHKDAGQRIGGIEEIQPSHYGTTLQDYREIARRAYPWCCNQCQYDDVPEILVVHHIDRNRSNNKLSNLEILCPNCHALEHRGNGRETRTRTENQPDPNRLP